MLRVYAGSDSVVIGSQRAESCSLAVLRVAADTTGIYVGNNGLYSSLTQQHLCTNL